MKQPVSNSSAFNVVPLGPRSLCLLLTKRSLFLTKLPILMMSHATSSSSIMRTACWTGTERATSLMRSRACRMAAGSQVLRVVLTVRVPSMVSSSALMPCLSHARFTSGQHDLMYTSRYFGNRIENGDSSSRGPPLLSLG